MTETLPPYVDTVDIPTAGTPVVLTSRVLHVRSVALFGASGNVGTVYVVDNATTAKKTPIPSGGIVLPINDPRNIQVDADNNGDDVEWIAV